MQFKHIDFLGPDLQRKNSVVGPLRNGSIPLLNLRAVARSSVIVDDTGISVSPPFRLVLILRLGDVQHLFRAFALTNVRQV